MAKEKVVTDWAEVKKECMELLSQILIKTKGVGAPILLADDDGYGETSPISKNDFEYCGEGELLEDNKGKKHSEDKFDFDRQYLACLKQYAERVAKGSVDAAAANETEYYSSRC